MKLRSPEPRLLVAAAMVVAGAVLFGCSRDGNSGGSVAPLPPPEITLVTPDVGGIPGGNLIRITTLDFQDDFTTDLPLVWFGPNPAVSVTATGPDEVVAETPAVAFPMVINVQVVSTGVVQGATLTDAFTYSDSFTRIFGQEIFLPSNSVVYVVKRSGAMAYPGGTWVDRFGNTVSGTRWDRGVDGVLASLGGLSTAIDFNIVTYACDRDKLSPAMVPATAANKADAEAWLAGHFPWGGSGDGPGGAEALNERQNLTVMLYSNGQPNCGASGTLGHTSMIVSNNLQGANVHTFGIADSGIFQQFLMEIASQTGGTYTQVSP